MYSDPNFNIRSEFVDPEEFQFLESPARTLGNDFEEGFGVLGRVIIGFLVFVGILFAALMLAAVAGWLWSFTQVNPPTQPQAQGSQHEYFQEARRSPARPVGGERSGNPPA